MVGEHDVVASGWLLSWLALCCSVVWSYAVLSLPGRKDQVWLVVMMTKLFPAWES